MDIYPLKFYEIYKPKIWGGRAMDSGLLKALPEGEIGESWEISDHFDDVSTVRNGSLEGRTLREVWREAPELVLGRELAQVGYDEFPLLVKFIDSGQVLSVQVHPDDEYARNHDTSGESGKNEAWYMLAARPGAQLVLGLKGPVTEEDFLRHIEDGSVEECLNYVDVKPGDFAHIAAGTVHAIGQGILLCEIQQTSDATYRICDWGRLGSDGKPRRLHVDHATSVVDFARGPVELVTAEQVQGGAAHREILDECEFFVIEKVHSAERFSLGEPADRFYILICIGGSGSIVAEGERCSYQLGDTILMPGALGAVTVEPVAQTTFLKTFIPRNA